MCKRCHGVFSELVDEAAYYRSNGYVCQSCGAQPHWETNAFRSRAWDREPRWRMYGCAAGGELWVGMGPNPELARQQWRWVSANKIRHRTPPGLIRDVDGTWMRARDLVGESVADPEALREDQFRRGFVIETLASTGGKVGAPTRGLRGQALDDAVEDILVGVFPDWDYFVTVCLIIGDQDPAKLKPHQKRKIREEFVRRLPRRPNTKELAVELDIKDRAARDLLSKVGAANSPICRSTKSTGGRPPQTCFKCGDVKLLVLEHRVCHDCHGVNGPCGRRFNDGTICNHNQKERAMLEVVSVELAEVRRELREQREQLADIMREIRDTARLVGERFPDDESVTDAVDRFLGDALAEAA
jgi:hypothetical protein